MSKKIETTASFSEFIKTIKDEKDSVQAVNLRHVINICNAIRSCKTSRAITKLPNIESEITNCLDMIDVYYRSFKHQKELIKSLNQLVSNCELDYITLMLKYQGGVDDKSE